MEIVKWCRLETPEGPSFGLVEGDRIELVQGSPFATFTRSGRYTPLAQARLLVPVVPPTFYAIGSNYHDHVIKMAEAMGRKPVFYDKPRVGYRANSALIAHGENIVKPADAGEEFQYEAELVAVIGKTARYITEDESFDHVAGYCVCNDVSEREFQAERGGTWDKGKGADTFGPTGPWMVTKDEVADPQNLSLWTEVNGKKMQNGSTKTMIFGVKTLVAYVSQFITLHPGDVIATGTPPGVALGMKPEPIFLQPGDVMRLGVEGLGIQTQRVLQA